MRRSTPIFYSALMLTAVNLLLRFFSTSFQVFLSGKIGAAGIGLLQLVLSVGSLTMTAGIAGIRTATMYLTAEELGRKRPGTVIWVISGAMVYALLFSCSIGYALSYFSPWICKNWIGDLRALNALRLYASFLPVCCMTGVMTGYFTAANRVGTLAAVEVTEQLVSMVLTVAALTYWAGNDPEKACMAVVGGSGMGACLTLACLVLIRWRSRSPVARRIPVAGRLCRTAIPLALADDLKAGISTAENLMVPKRLALYAGASDPMALFGTVCGMVFPVLMFPACLLFGLTELLIPELARCNAAGSKRRIRYLVRRSLRMTMIYGTLCGSILFLCSDALCMKLYSNPQAGEYLRWFALLSSMLYCDIVTDSMIKGLGQQTASVRYNIFTSAMDLGLLFLLLPRYGMEGYFFSFAVTHAINFFLSLRRLLKITGQRIPLYTSFLTLSSAAAGIWIAGWVQRPVMRGIGFTVIFLCLLALMQVVNKKDLLWLRGLIRRTPQKGKKLAA